MSDVKEIARLMGELEEQLVVCMRCGMCQAVCPVFAQTGREADVARGKLALLDGLMQELFQDPAGVSERLDRCLLCGRCAANCPSGVKVLDIFLKARAILTAFGGLSPAKRLILRGLLAHPALLDRMAEWASRFQKIFTRSADAIIGTSCARIASPLLGGRHFRTLAPQPFHQDTPARDTPAGVSGLRVGVFVGCLIDKIFPHIAKATMEVLDAHGVGVFLPPNQGCCGIPALSSGDRATFLRLLRHNLDRFEAGQFDALVTACATCTSTIKKVWPIMVQDQPAALRRRVEDLAGRTADISAFIVTHFDPAPAGGAGDPRTTVTYHDPCHLKQSLGVAAAPRQLIRANHTVRLVEMAEPDTCCGMGGSFNLQHYLISCEIGKRKAEQIAACGAEVVATGCPACMLQISDMLSRKGYSMRVRHPVEIYSEAKRAP